MENFYNLWHSSSPATKNKNVLRSKNKRQPVDRESFVVSFYISDEWKIFIFSEGVEKSIFSCIVVRMTHSFTVEIECEKGERGTSFSAIILSFLFLWTLWTFSYDVSSLWLLWSFYCIHFGVIKFLFYYFHVLTIIIISFSACILCTYFIYILISDFSCSFGRSMCKNKWLIT